MPINLRGPSRSSYMRRSARRGVATLWLILMLPVLLILLCLVVEITNLWLARLELEDGLESSALAAVQEWGESGGIGGTLGPRNIGIEFASENTVRGNPIVLTNNYDPGSLPNENAATTGPTADLVFGAITQTSPTVIFNANAGPGGSLGPVALDATNLLPPSAAANDTFWGVNFKSAAGQPAGLEIRQIVINLRSAPGSDQNAFFQGTPVLSDNSPKAVPTQNDLSGISAADLTFTLTPLADPNPYILTINFVPGGFIPGERFRFGAELRNLNPPGVNPNGGDAVGNGNVSGTITFAIGGIPQPPVPFQYVNVLQQIILGPAPYVIPSVPGATPTNGQSFVEVKGSGGSDFAVRAQKSVTVPPVCGSVMGAIFGPFTVQADTVAEYNRDTKIPRIIRVDQFIPPP
jgi:hypothetical protein